MRCAAAKGVPHGRVLVENARVLKKQGNQMFLAIYPVDDEIK